MDLLKILATLLLIGLLVYWLIKKNEPGIVLWTVGLIGIMGAAAAFGSPLNEEAATGILVADVFIYIYNLIYAQMGNVLIFASVMGYVEMMNEIKATTKLASIMAKPLIKLNKPWLILFISCLMITVLHVLLPNRSALFFLLLGTFFPVWRAIGITKPTAYAVALFSCTVDIGPAMPASVFAAGILEIDVIQYFITKELPIACIQLVSMLIICFFVNNYFDKKQGISMAPDSDISTVDLSDTPGWFAFLPAIPLILLFIFSDFVTGITLSVPVVYIFCLYLIFIIASIKEKSIRQGFIISGGSFFLGVEKMIRPIAILVLGGSIFSGAVEKIGGIYVLVNWIGKAGVSNAIVIGLICGSIMYLLGTFFSNTVAFTSFGPSLIKIYEVAGVSLAKGTTVMVASACLANSVRPISPGVLSVIGMEKDITLGNMMLRMQIPAICGWIILVITSSIIA